MTTAYKLLASERGRISVELGGGGARGKYGQPKNYDILYYAYIVAILNEPITQHELKIKGILNYNKNNGCCK